VSAGEVRAVTAWRCWSLRHPPGVLYSHLDPWWPRREIEWVPGWQSAECAFNDHPAPDDSDLCSRCGWRGEPDLATLIWWLADHKRVRPRAVGGILRAERARVAGPVVVAPGYAGHAGPLAVRYGVQVRLSSASCFSPSWVRACERDAA
jgi:hypothetical protein